MQKKGNTCLKGTHPDRAHFGLAKAELWGRRNAFLFKGSGYVAVMKKIVNIEVYRTRVGLSHTLPRS